MKKLLNLAVICLFLFIGSPSTADTADGPDSLICTMAGCTTWVLYLETSNVWTMKIQCEEDSSYYYAHPH